jgi:hypothetical protein
MLGTGLVEHVLVPVMIGTCSGDDFRHRAPHRCAAAAGMSRFFPGAYGDRVDVPEVDSPAVGADDGIRLDRGDLELQLTPVHRGDCDLVLRLHSRRDEVRLGSHVAHRSN